MSRFLILPPKQLETKIRQKNNNMKQRKPNRHGHIPIPSRYLQINNPLIHFHAKKAEFETLAPGFLSIAKGQNFSESEFTPWLNHLKSVVKSYLIPRMVGKWWLLLFVFLFQKPKHGRDRRDEPKKQSATASTFHLSSLATHWTGASFHPSKPDKDRHAVEKLS